MSAFRVVVYPTSTGCQRSVAPGRAYQSNSLAPATACLKSSCICPFKLSNKRTNLSIFCSLTNERSVSSHQLLYTFWSNQAFGWKYTSTPLCHSDFSFCEMRFPWPLKMIANFGCSPSGRNLTCREHWRFSNPEPGYEIHVLCGNLYPLVCTRRFPYRAQQKEKGFDRHLTCVQVDSATISDHN